MPTTVELRSGIDSLTVLAAADLDVVWQLVTSAAEAREALAAVLPGVIEAYGSAAATLAADWYDELRDDEGIAGRFTAIPADLADPGAEALAGWGVSPLFKPEPDWPAAKTLVEGGLQRRIANYARDTVIGSAVADPQAHGWQRVAKPDGCGFCQMLAGRGTVYRSRRSADFGAHDHCSCTATVAWRGRQVPVRPYTPSTRNISDADRARAREWIAANL